MNSRMLTTSAMFTFFLTLCLTGPALCQEKDLQWKLTKGDRLQLDIQQLTRTTRTFKNNELVMDHDATMVMQWVVTGVSEKGAEVTQTFRQIKLKIDTPKGNAVEYDSSSETRPSGDAKILADAIKPLIGTSVLLQFNAKGKITSAKVSDEASQAVKHAVATTSLAVMFSPEGMQSILKQFIFTMPEEAVSKGSEWKDTESLSLPTGKLTTLNKYTYLGEKKTEQGVLDQIGVATTVQVQKEGDEAPGKPDFVHKQSGEMLFDNSAGRPVSSKVTQTIISERKIGDLEVNIKSEATSTMTIKPLLAATLQD